MKTALEFLHSLDGVVAIDASVAIIAARDAEWQARVEAAEAAEMVRDDRGDIECVFELLDLAKELDAYRAEKRR